MALIADTKGQVLADRHQKAQKKAKKAFAECVSISTFCTPFFFSRLSLFSS